MTRKVLIIGGGVGGLSAALELAQRGFEVTLKDKENDIGGRYRSHKVNILGEEFQLSTGFHGKLKEPEPYRWGHVYFIS